MLGDEAFESQAAAAIECIHSVKRGRRGRLVRTGDLPEFDFAAAWLWLKEPVCVWRPSTTMSLSWWVA